MVVETTEFITYAFINLLVISFGFMLTFYTKKVQNISWRFHLKLYKVTNIKLLKKISDEIWRDNQNPKFIKTVKLNGIIIFLISLLAFIILVVKWKMGLLR